MKPPRSAYPWHWRVLDVLERVVETAWPRRFTKGLPHAMLVPVVLLVAILIAGLVEMLDSSFRVLDTNTFLMSDFYTLDNYRRALTENFFQSVATRSFIASFIVTAITLVVAVPYAYLMVRTQSPALRKFLLVALFFPFFIGEVVRAYGWLIILGNQGLVNEFLGLFGLSSVRLLYNYSAVIFGLVQYMLPFAVLMIAPALTAIPEELEAAANSLGANWIRTFRHVVLPLARPGLVAGGLVVMTLSLTNFAIPAMLGGGSQDFMSNVIYDQFFRTSDQGLGSALSILLVIAGSILVGIIFRLFGTGSLAIKGARK
ncbi:ABC transporter permease [Shinella daejeonensis]|uniref:ABC transporter permease n=1 Tax=Shinella daejeonensis TaxID=659017 RepID=UPI0020C74AC3|nr:ABC transporter permease [Shinella daejeonensis]MCP8894449.1 ABC transporter permease [Shinella daejeonensis]